MQKAVIIIALAAGILIPAAQAKCSAAGGGCANKCSCTASCATPGTCAKAGCTTAGKCASTRACAQSVSKPAATAAKAKSKSMRRIGR